MSSSILINCVFTVDLSDLLELRLRSILEIACLSLVGQAGEKWRGKKMVCILERHSRGHQHPALR